MMIKLTGGAERRPRPRGAVRRLLLAALVAVPLMTVSTQPAYAACGYQDYGTGYPMNEAGSHYQDGGIWISLRRNQDCRFYAVVNNKKATGRDYCYWELTGLNPAEIPNGRFRGFDCPAAGAPAIYSPAYGAGNTGTVTAFLEVSHQSGPLVCPYGVHYNIFFNNSNLKPPPLRQPYCGA